MVYKKRKVFSYLLRVILSILLFASFKPDVLCQRQHKGSDSDRRFLIGIAYGAQFSGAFKQMRTDMNKAGLGDDVQIGHSHYTYPSGDRMFGSYNVELSYRLNSRYGVSLGGGLSERFIVKGASDKSEGLRLFLENKVHHVKALLEFQASKRSTIQVGPSLTFLSSEDQRYQAFNYQASSSKVVPGASIGYKFDLIDSKVFFASILVNGNFVFNTDIGPFYAHGRFIFPDFDDPVKYNPKINFSSAFVMLGVGYKIF